MEKEEKIIQAYAKELNNRLGNLKELECTDNDIYHELSSDLGNIISILSEKYPSMNLEELKPIIKVFTDFKRDYLGDS
ncbi:hypothetical protein [Gracilibacillus sp. YIM 98692]|uniref:hypothetical protein n=1 Tax=Gracilibacillus sp. YIM 98692 TaxID=2663532 RepID=UPI0013D4F03B|nr:hypothetical protein [Gracilibacillus sp. YIM 98692]